MTVSSDVGGGKTFPAFPAHAQPAILRIWQEVHSHLNIPLQFPDIMIIIRIYNDAMQADV